MKRRTFAKAGLSTLTMPLSLSLVACGGAESPADVAFSSSAPSSGAAVGPVVMERPRVEASTKPVTSYADERIFVGPSGVVYTLNKEAKMLRYEQNLINLVPAAQANSPSNPVDLAFDANGNAYVLDKSLAEVRVYDAAWQLQRRVARQGKDDAALSSPSALAVHQDRLFIADSANHRVQVFSLAGAPLLRFGSLGAQASSFNYPIDIKVSAEGRIYVLHANSTVSVHEADGRVAEQFDLSKDAQGQRQIVRAIALTPSGQLYFSDVRTSRVYALEASGKVVVKHQPQSAAGKPVAARHLAVGPDGQVYVSGLLPLVA